ncbi:hypothetical protein ACFQDG_12745 [Natronoarchaeum mannanilyticum]|uniref:DUF7544 domain-containing protein n=1 Tax=Natronoarchaeum mannanilyticum TaxID=926360 RepID=UPI00360ED98B
MPWHALEALDDALTATREFLLPFSLRRWLTLAVVAFFVSGATAFEPSPSFSFGDGAVGGGPEPGPPDPAGIGLFTGELTASQLQLLVALVAVLLIVGLVLAYVATVLEFVFVEILRDREVQIRGRFGRYTDAGASLFLFRLAVGVVVLSAVLGVVALVVLTGGLFVIALVLLSPAFLLVGVGLWLLLAFTADFVVPAMIVEEAGVVDGWRAFWPELRAEWRQYAAYALARIVLGGVAGVGAGIGFVAAGVPLGIPFGIVAGGLFLIGQAIGSSAIGLALAGAVAALWLIAVLVVGTTFVQVPIQTYLRYYSLLVLGAVSPAFDLLADVRADLADASDASDASDR